jgi:uncharacterized protein (DUF362 family)
MSKNTFDLRNIDLFKIKNTNIRRFFMKRSIAIIISIMFVLAITFPAVAVSTIVVKSIKLNISKITLKVGQTSNLKVTFTPANTSQKKLTYVTGNKKIATVNTEGKITGVSSGTTTITVYTLNKKIFAKCNVIVPKLKNNAVQLKDGNNIKGISEDEKKKHVEEVMKKAFEKPDPNPVVGIGRGEDFGKVTAEAIDNAGGLKDIIQKGNVVLIKPNICKDGIDVGRPEITDYRIVQKVADLALKYGASKVVVAEGGFYGNVFDYEKNGYATLKGVELFNFNSCEEKDSYELKPQESLVGRAIFIPKIYMDADVVIDIAKMKTHYLTWVSLSLKNCIGIPSGRIYGSHGAKTGVHNLGLSSAIVDINRIRKPDLAIIDGIIAGDGQGPVGNTPVKANIVLAGKDLVALDTAALTFMGGKIEDVAHLMLASKNGLGISDLSKIKIVGADLNTIKMEFTH